jgi:RND family efflux transporter MFP subunit
LPELRRASLLLLVALAALTAGCGEEPAPSSAPVSATGPESPVEVETARVRRGSILQRVAAPGSLVAKRQSEIGVEVTGRIVEVFVEEGDRVEAGQPLFQIDPEPYAVALRAASAALDVARAERDQVEADLARARALREKDVVAEQAFDRLETQLAVAKARAREANERRALVEQDLARTLVRAPYAASVAARLVDEGTTALVQPQTVVVVLQETAELEARATIPESQLALVGLGDRAFVHVEGVPDPIETQVSSVSDTIDPATRTYLVRMRVPNPDHALKAGVFAHVEIVPQAKSDVVLVPREALRTEDGRTRVLTVQEGRVVAVPVALGLVSEDDAEVLRGVEVGAEVVVGEAAGKIAPGMQVKVASDGSEPAP